MKHITTFLTLQLFIFSFSLHAQHHEKEKPQSGKITGKIIDSASGEAIEYVAVSLLKQEDGKVVNGATADAKGVFKLENVANGTYSLVLDFIGYQKITRTNIIVSEQSPNVALGNITLVSKQKTLKEITVTSEKNIVENKIDKMVYNVDKDITSQNGVAADVLKKVPQVSVDVDGNVELQGNANVRFLIDGKPSVLFGNNIAEVLQSIPSSQIQSIEVITIPGAKYDAQGTGGIINIILKKNKAQGMNGNISLSAGTRLENGSLNFNVRKNKLGINAFCSGNAQLTPSTVNSMDRSSWDTNTASRLLQNGNSDFNRHGFESGIGFDWDPTDKDNFEGTLGYDYFGNNTSGSANRQSILQDVSGNILSDVNDAILTTNKFHERSLDGALSYKRKFEREDQELEISCNTSNGNNFSYYKQTQKHISPESIFNSSYGNNPGIENETNVELNYTHPVNEDFIIETGAKIELSHINSLSDVYLLNTASDSYNYSNTQSSTLDFKRNVYAGYLSSTFKIFDWLDVKAGARYEYTETKAVFSNVGFVNINPYNTLVPSLVFMHKFKKEQTLKLSYTRRIERPEYRDVNPFIDASDPKNMSTGNPNLRPEIGDKIELGYSQPVVKKGNITTTLFFRGNTDDIQPYTRFYPLYTVGDSTYNDVSIRFRENIGHENNYGLNLFVSIPVTEKINIRSNISGFQRYIYTGISSTGDIHGFNYRANANATYQVSSTLIMELFGNFNSPRINAQGTMPSFTTYNFAFRKQLFRKKASIAFTATNFLNEYVKQETKLTGDNFSLENMRQLPYRSFGINFTYKFGKLEFKKGREGEDLNLTNPLGN